MKISKGSWIYNAYVAALEVLDRFNFRDIPDDALRAHTDLCRFVRVFVIWVPFVVITQLVTLASMVACLIWLPIVYNGLSSYLAAIAWIVGVGIFIGVVVYISTKWWTRWRQREKPEKVKKTSGAMSVAFAYIKAKKSKVCPFIEFSE